MANEAVLDVEYSVPVPFTIGNAAAVEKGATLRLLDPMTLSGSGFAAGGNDVFGGIASVEKIANDGVTSLGVYRDGRFKVKLSGSCSAGDALTLGDSVDVNYFKKATNTLAGLSGANVAAIALETGTTDQTIFVEIRPIRIGTAA